MAAGPIRETDLLQAVLNSLPVAAFLIDDDFNILDVNSEATHLFGLDSDVALHRVCGEVMHCMHAIDSAGGCGTTQYCRDCIVRNAAEEAGAGKKTYRKKYQMKLRHGDRLSEIHMLVTASPLDYHGDSFVLLALEDVTDIVTLKRLLPICSNCKKIRNDDDYWEAVTDYLAKHSGIDFTHSICPQCVEALYPDVKIPTP